ncbi:MAG: protein translocase subunit SecD [Gemmatimonadetes bacterium]|nr:protein translocase subunit SecD [Gemmatimonadota bacterium]MYA64637.1 protein translocase subunit SecD [Gemmatimonadota bacterium]MYB99224.1 protein translocase subunit SecD [Gemmatimonadota bacterium]MYH52046.1 protein translocase subunit SecD [Gemmatimonadota bacterium]MYI46659.1 protein translocase subunit SecD [Gemmatimonadota bacterium]
MLKSFRGRIVIIVLAVGVAGFYLWDRDLKLGLDLQGGMHLVLEIDDPEGTFTEERREALTEQALKILRTRIDAFGVEEPIIQKRGSDRIIVELAGIDDEQRAKDIINRQAFLEWKLVVPTHDVDQALPRLDRAIVAALGEDSLRTLGARTQVQQTEELSPELLLFPDADDTAQSAETAAAETSTETDSATEAAAQEEDDASLLHPFAGLLLTGGFDNKNRPVSYRVDMDDVETADIYLSLDAFQRALPRDVSLQWGLDPVQWEGRFYRELFVLEEDAFLTGAQLQEATASRDPQFNHPEVLFELNRLGGREFERVTRNAKDERIAIILDGEVVSAPVVEGVIRNRGSIKMQGSPMADAADLALVLRAGALPVPLSIMEERTVGPSLGQDSIDQGRIAGIIGIIMVIGIMMFYYRMAGILAVVALGIYLLLVLGGLAALNATLTLPGIAGLILSIGMAVDANVLIFERIREELEARRAPRTAVEEGFGNAVSAIVDANITTLITGLILFQFGTGPVQGFAVTLCIGIVASFFSAMYVTRTLFLMYLTGKRGSDPISV